MKRHHLLITAAALSLAGGMLAMATPAHASSYFLLQNDGSSFCLGISGGNDNAPAVQWQCESSALNQQWHWQTSDGTYNELVNGDGECLGILGGDDNHTAGAQVVGWNCGILAANQQWQQNGGLYVNYDGMVLGVAGGSTKEGADVVQWPHQRGAANQIWYQI